MEEQKIIDEAMQASVPEPTDTEKLNKLVEPSPEAKVLDGKNAAAMASDITNAMSYDKSQYLYPKDVRSLKRHKYDVIAERFYKGYVIRNTKTGQIVELRAASACHAATMINWRHRQVEVLDIIQHAKVVDAKPVETKVESTLYN